MGLHVLSRAGGGVRAALDDAKGMPGAIPKLSSSRGFAGPFRSWLSIKQPYLQQAPKRVRVFFSDSVLSRGYL